MNDETKLSDLTVGEFKELIRGLNNFKVNVPPTKTTGQIQAEMQNLGRTNTSSDGQALARGGDHQSLCYCPLPNLYR